MQPFLRPVGISRFNPQSSEGSLWPLRWCLRDSSSFSSYGVGITFANERGKRKYTLSRSCNPRIMRKEVS